jgi:LCP family protein required for cell wall assembly
MVRTDPSRHRLAYLSIPRDLRVDIPGHGPNKINAAFQLGGPVLAMKTVRALTGLQVNHVVLVDFQDFREVIDALGGVEIDVPTPIVSNRFDCPYATETRCRQWEGWRFEKGKQTMDGRRALIYSRIRENRLDPSENDLTRGGRQQEVVEAMTDKIVGPRTFVRLPFVGDDLMKPLTTDLSSGQLLQLGWVRFRANSSRALHCRLGGEPQSIGGESVLVATEENAAAIAMFIGRSAAQPPPPGTTFGAGCVVGTGVGLPDAG